MAGYPASPSRAAFGPTYEDKIPVRDPSRELGAAAMNLGFWQLAGAGRVLPKAVVLLGKDTDAFSVRFQALAWDPDGKLPALSATRNDTGDYTLVFAATYADERGVQVPFLPKAALASVNGAYDYNTGGVVFVDAHTLRVKVLDASAVAQDALVLLAVWG